jgi:hypothetical protein
MRNPHAYPELILDAAQQEIQTLARKNARDQSRRAARAARRRSRIGAWSWWRSCVTGSRQRRDSPGR